METKKQVEIYRKNKQSEGKSTKTKQEVAAAGVATTQINHKTWNIRKLQHLDRPDDV